MHFQNYATRDALAERLQSVLDAISLLDNRMMEYMGYGQQEWLKDVVKKEAEEEEKPAAGSEEEEIMEQQQDDDERYNTVTKIKLAYEGKQEDNHGQHHTTHWDDGKGHLFI